MFRYGKENIPRKESPGGKGESQECQVMDAQEENLQTAEGSLTLTPGKQPLGWTGDQWWAYGWTQMAKAGRRCVVRLDTWRNVAMKERTLTSWEGKGLKIKLFLARRDLHVLKGRRKKPVQRKNFVAQRRTTYLGAGSGTAVTKRRAHSRTLINVCWWADYTVCTG